MKKLELHKKNKRIKIIEKDKNLIVTGPLGSIVLKSRNIFKSSAANLFVEDKDINFFYNELKEAITSVTTGWYKELNLNGIGYKSFKIEDKIALDLGYSNLVTFKANNQIKIKNLKNKIVLFGINKEYLNNVALRLKHFSSPDAYKGKGILYKNEILKLKKKAKS